MTNISQKELFFSDFLVPAGQLAEVYLFHVAEYNRSGPSQFLFESLGLASAFAISPSTPDDKKLFKTLSENVSKIIDFVKNELAPLNREKPTSVQEREFRTNVNSFVARLTPHVQVMFQTMSYTPGTREAWLRNIMKVSTPLTLEGSYNKWRTFVRHVDFQSNMKKLGVELVAKAVPVLGSNQGKAEAPELWRKCFDTDWASGELTQPSRPLLPPRARVTSNAVGMLEVSLDFNPKHALRKVIAGLPGNPSADFAEELAPVSFSKTCDYTELPAVVAEMLDWENKQQLRAVATTAALQEWSEEAQAAAVRKRFEASFTPEERALLAKSKLSTSKAVKAPVAKSAAKPAAKPAAKAAARSRTKA